MRRSIKFTQYTSIRYGEQLAELGAIPSIGSVGDAFDSALAESVNGLYKTEVVRGPGQGPWRSVEDVELATLSWVHWYNTARLHEYLSYVPPAEFEHNWAATNPSATSHSSSIDRCDIKADQLAFAGMFDIKA